MQHFLGQQHKHERRKRTTHKHAPRSKKSYVRGLDRITFIAGIVGPFTVLPQVYSIFITQNADGVSGMSWALIFIVTLPWVFYGFAHRDRSIIISFILWEVMNVLVFVGVLLYG